MQMVLHDLPRSQGKPLSETDIRELRLLQNLKKDNIFGARVLQIMARGRGDISNIAGREVVSCTSVRRDVHAEARVTGDDEVPFVRVGMPARLLVPSDIFHDTMSLTSELPS